MYENISDEDLSHLFDSCVLRYNNIPVLLKPRGGRVVSITSVGGNEYDGKHVHIYDEKFNYSPVPLGYCNVDGYAYHVSRRPRRQWIVGLHQRNMVVKSINLQQSDKSLKAISSFRTKGLRDCINGVYPSIGEAIELLDGKEATTVGIDRSFAMDRDHCLYFKEERIGIMEPGNKPVFFNTKNYLKILWEQGYAGTRA